MRRLTTIKKELTIEGNSLYILGPKNIFRVVLSKIVVHDIFELFIFLTVLFSSIFMVFENPLSDPERDFLKIAITINRVITGIFVTELVLKILVFGLIWNGPDSYLKNGWNVLDFIIVSTSIATLIVEFQTDGNSAATKDLELLKMLRVLRSLRMISRNEGLKLSVLSLIYSMPGIMNVTIVTGLFMLIFGIFFLNLFKGKFYYCELPAFLADDIGIKTIKKVHDCYNYGGIWKNPIIHFDNIISAIFALFTMSTTEGWVTVMNGAVDSVGIGMQPKRDNNPLFKYIFILYMIFGSLFITNLFIEVVINTFDK